MIRPSSAAAVAALALLLAGCPGGDFSSDLPDCERVEVVWTLPDGMTSEEPWSGLSNAEVIETLQSAYADQQAEAGGGCRLPQEVAAEIELRRPEARQEAIAASDWQDRLLPEMDPELSMETQPAEAGFGVADDEWMTWIISVRGGGCSLFGPDAEYFSLGLEGVGRWGQWPIESTWSGYEARGPNGGTLWMFMIEGDHIVDEEPIGEVAPVGEGEELYVIVEPCLDADRRVRAVEDASNLPAF